MQETLKTTQMTMPKRTKQLSRIYRFSEIGSDSVFIYDWFPGQDLSSVGEKTHNATSLESLFNLKIMWVIL